MAMNLKPKNICGYIKNDDDYYQKTRSSSCPREFLKGFSGFLQTDGYQGYNKVENVKRVYCLAHILKPFVIGRKNWLFANTAKGARASATIYSMIETAKANNLKIERYLIYLFDNLSNMEIREKDLLLELMPWSDTIPEELKLKSSK